MRSVKDFMSQIQDDEEPVNHVNVVVIEPEPEPEPEPQETTENWEEAEIDIEGDMSQTESNVPVVDDTIEGSFIEYIREDDRFIPYVIGAGIIIGSICIALGMMGV